MHYLHSFYDIISIIQASDICILPYCPRPSQSLKTYLVGDANDTASGAGTSVTSLLGLLVSALAKVISAGVDDNGALF